MNIVNVGYDSTNFYVLTCADGRLLIDSGWPGTLPRLVGELKRKGVPPDEIRHLLVTHFHPDHAGLTQELKDRGAQLILMHSQVDFVPRLGAYYRPKNYPYVEIRAAGNVVLSFAESRGHLRRLGLDGEIVATPGHTEDSVTLILDEGAAFTGDLAPRNLLPEDDLVSRQSWDRIYEHRVTRIYPAHGG
jgi:glyoxylase-like metal-dependent hydrolase (beta-lactamase superfamily II)